MDEFVPLASLDDDEAIQVFRDIMLELLDPLNGVEVSEITLDVEGGAIQATVRVPLGGYGPVGPR